jgi:multidrug efflux pump subunit AcrB
MDGSLGEFMRRFVPAVLAAFALSVSGLFLAALVLPGTPALAASVFVETNPSTARAGDEVGVRASCTDNLKAATVVAGPIGKLTVAPRYGFLTTTAKVPTTTRPGDYTVSLTCPDGKTAKSTLHVVAKVEPVRGPATGGGGTAPGRFSPVLIAGGLASVAAGVVLAVFSARRRRFG